MAVQQYIAQQTSTNRQVLTVLRNWILDLGPHVSEKISYQVPFFYFYGPLCYLSVKDDSVSLSFVHGNLLEDESKLLEEKGRKQIRSITFFSVAGLEEYEDQVRQLLNEAAILNEYQYKRKQKLRKKK